MQFNRMFLRKLRRLVDRNGCDVIFQDTRPRLSKLYEMQFDGLHARGSISKRSLA
jgi:hypothetical protein